MAGKVQMRSPRDRLRHAILFELIALVLVAPLGGSVFDVDVGHFGVVALVSTALAMLWTYGYNLVFDLALLRLGLGLKKSLRLRAAHAVLFEAGLLILLVPFIAWYLAVPLWEAFLMDVSLAGFYLVYAFVFNWLYDLAVPLPSPDG
ncbi:PACE efflux transporter [Tabrizicola soli]|uniref:PACE efflux transporter n=1 Tax=Tabrizicola soli TaxID=2185115 RepID=A0ABV7DTK3_9RHOB